jgi:VWFA-related protein
MVIRPTCISCTFILIVMFSSFLVTPAWHEYPTARQSQIPSSVPVFLPISVVDAEGNPYPGLDQTAFTIMSGRVTQDIISFEGSGTPATIGIILDMSSSLSSLYAKKGDSRDYSIHALLMSLVKQINESNEYFIVAFALSQQVLLESTDSLNSITAGISNLKPLNLKGPAAFFDVCHFGVEKISQAKHKKRVLIVISDGEGGVSRDSERDILKLLKENNVRIYIIDMNSSYPFTGSGKQAIPHVSSYPHPMEEAQFERRAETMRRLASVTGGRAFAPFTKAELEEALQAVRSEINSMYLVGIKPSIDNKYYSLTVKVKPPRKGIRLEARAAEGYRASINK